jgi:hypothetical protein
MFVTMGRGGVVVVDLADDVVVDRIVVAASVVDFGPAAVRYQMALVKNNVYWPRSRFHQPSSIRYCQSCVMNVYLFVCTQKKEKLRNIKVQSRSNNVQEITQITYMSMCVIAYMCGCICTYMVSV